jgi:hypothetical protein
MMLPKQQPHDDVPTTQPTGATAGGATTRTSCDAIATTTTSGVVNQVTPFEKQYNLWSSHFFHRDEFRRTTGSPPAVASREPPSEQQQQQQQQQHLEQETCRSTTTTTSPPTTSSSAVHVVPAKQVRFGSQNEQEDEQEDEQEEQEDDHHHHEQEDEEDVDDTDIEEDDERNNQGLGSEPTNKPPAVRHFVSRRGRYLSPGRRCRSAPTTREAASQLSVTDTTGGGITQEYKTFRSPSSSSSHHQQQQRSVGDEVPSLCSAGSMETVATTTIVAGFAGANNKNTGSSSSTTATAAAAATTMMMISCDHTHPHHCSPLAVVTDTTSRRTTGGDPFESSSNCSSRAYSPPVENGDKVCTNVRPSGFEFCFPKTASLLLLGSTTRGSLSQEISFFRFSPCAHNNNRSRQLLHPTTKMTGCWMVTTPATALPCSCLPHATAVALKKRNQIHPLAAIE